MTTQSFKPGFESTTTQSFKPGFESHYVIITLQCNNDVITSLLQNHRCVIITSQSLLHYYYNVNTSLIHCFYIIITTALLHHYHIIITKLLHEFTSLYYVIITNSSLHIIWSLLRHY